ncbi:hypothetical protein ABZ707_15290 [Streptomyces sp. NPDC006923]|uniref:hypothetical protein n=1 Tax=Streptomyces sp. NPDC006923 TaxID=3155355 RepID=UPI0033D6A6E8
MSRDTSPDERLGALLGTHPVNRRRYVSTGSAALACVVGGGIVMVLLVSHPFFLDERLLILGVLPTLVGLPVAVVQLTRAVRSSPGETYELYENGLGHRASGVVRRWTWDEVAVLRATVDMPSSTRPAVPLDGYLQRLGWHVRCAVRFTDGARVRVDGCVADGHVVARTLLARCPDAVPHGKPSTFQRIMLVVLPVVIALSAFLSLSIIRFMDSTDSSDEMLVVLVLSVLASLLSFVASAVWWPILLVSVVRSRRHAVAAAGVRQRRAALQAVRERSRRDAAPGGSSGTDVGGDIGGDTGPDTT